MRGNLPALGRRARFLPKPKVFKYPPDHIRLRLGDKKYNLHLSMAFGTSETMMRPGFATA